MELYNIIGTGYAVAEYDYGIVDTGFVPDFPGDFHLERTGETTLRKLREEGSPVAAYIEYGGAEDEEDGKIDVYEGTHDGESVTIYAPEYWG